MQSNKTTFNIVYKPLLAAGVVRIISNNLIEFYINMRTILTFILTLLIGQQIFATAQIPDRIIYNGKEYNLHSNPLEGFFEKYPDKRPQEGIISTALWRGYIATFKVKQNQLFLIDIQIEYQDTSSKEDDNFKWKSVIGEVFPGNQEIKIDWFTGLLVIPHGKLMNYVHMGYSSTYKKYILLEINHGNLKKELNFDHKDYELFKERQFQAFKQSEEYIRIKADLQKDGSTDQFIDSFLRSFVTEYTSKILIE